MSDLLKRSLTGIIYVTVVIAGTIFHPLVFLLVFGSLLFLSQREFYRLIENTAFGPQRITGQIFGILLFIVCFGIANQIVPPQSALLLIPLFILIFVFELFRKNIKPLQNSAITLLGLVYVAIPFCVLNFIVFPGAPSDTTFYPWILTGIFFIIWMNDSMAYLAGTMFGKHKIHKRISPKKSWEGFIGGAVFAVIMGILNAVFFQALSMLSWIVTAVIIVIFGTLGDLFESKIKRDLEVKDSGNILPGHGGFLDRLDSLLFAIPVIFIWLIVAGNL